MSTTKPPDRTCRCMACWEARLTPSEGKLASEETLTETRHELTKAHEEQLKEAKVAKVVMVNHDWDMSLRAKPKHEHTKQRVNIEPQYMSTTPPPEASDWGPSLEQEKLYIQEQVNDGNMFGRTGSYRGHGAGALKSKGPGTNSNAGRQTNTSGGGSGCTGKNKNRPRLGR